MKASSSQIIRNYVYGEILCTTAICTSVITLILFYGNLTKYDEQLFRILYVSSSLFIEIIILMLPFAVSLGLPFGFSLALIFCVGQWSANQETMAFESMGVRKMLWMRYVFFSAIIVSILGCFTLLHWAPIARNAFEQKVESFLRQDFHSFSHLGHDLEINFQSDSENLWFDDQINRASIAIGRNDGSTWENIRVLLWDKTNNLGGIIHAQNGIVESRNNGLINLFLHDVDFETAKGDQKSFNDTSTFISFDKWDHPLSFRFDNNHSPHNSRDSVVSIFLKGNIGSYFNKENIESLNRLNKYSSIALSPLFLSPLLLFLGLKKGRKESYSNIFFGVVTLMFYFVLGHLLSEFLGDEGYGWWFSNALVVTIGSILLWN